MSRKKTNPEYREGNRSARSKASPLAPAIEPMELARLAAMVAPQDEPHRAMEKAMTFYIEANLFCKELPGTLEELLRLFGSQTRKMAALSQELEKAQWANRKKIWANCLELDNEENEDDVRRFLADRGMRFKTARGVLENLRRYLKSPTPLNLFRPPVDPNRIIDKCKRTRDGRTIYAIPATFLESVAAVAQLRRSEAKRRAWRTRKGKSNV
jgi:hypothetical protein